MPKKTTQKSGFQIPAKVPTVQQMIVAGQASAEKIRRMTKGALVEYIKQSERLHIGMFHYGFRGVRFTNFADSIGVDRTSAYRLRKLCLYGDKILKRCRAEGRFYGWETCLYWHVTPPPSWNHRHQNQSDRRSDERRTPPKIFQRFGADCTLDVAATADNALCADFYTKEQDGLKQPWHGVVWLNPPYSNVAPWLRKTVEYVRSGGRVIALLPAWTNATFFHQYCKFGQITFLKQRLVFGNADANAPFPSIVVEFSPETLAMAQYGLNARLDGQEPPRRSSHDWPIADELVAANDNNPQHTPALDATIE
jgi:phage N-6-adenine-methyltransferase